jgi:murein DD-endopeptidase MepM/ murein hydrolase activator NlpD
MKFSMPTTAGSVRRWSDCCAAMLACLALIAATASEAQVYRYRDENGRWVFSDRQPEAGQEFELDDTPTGSRRPDPVRIWREDNGSSSRILASNQALYPVEVAAWLVSASNLRALGKDDGVRAVLAPGEQRTVLELEPLDPARDWSFDFRAGFVPGDPAVRHDDGYVYRPPFAPATSFRLSQAYPDAITHVTPDSEHAVDIAMPEGAGVFAARDGLVVEVAYSNFQGGFDMQRFGREANLVRILHGDGSFAVYAHLSWDSIRVRVGQEVVRGQPIGASGNTGFSSGPHLHFAVLRNDGLKPVSVPVRFSDPSGGSVAPRTGAILRNP